MNVTDRGFIQSPSKVFIYLFFGKGPPLLTTRSRQEWWWGGGVVSKPICNIFIHHVKLNVLFPKLALEYLVGTCKHLLKMLSSDNSRDSLLSDFNPGSTCSRCEKIHAMLKKRDLTLKLTAARYFFQIFQSSRQQKHIILYILYYIIYTHIYYVLYKKIVDIYIFFFLVPPETGAHLMVRRSHPRMAVSLAVASWLQLWCGLHLPEVNFS